MVLTFKDYFVSAFAPKLSSLVGTDGKRPKLPVQYLFLRWSSEDQSVYTIDKSVSYMVVYLV